MRLTTTHETIAFNRVLAEYLAVVEAGTALDREEWLTPLSRSGR